MLGKVISFLFEWLLHSLTIAWPGCVAVGLFNIGGLASPPGATPLLSGVPFAIGVKTKRVVSPLGVCRGVELIGLGVIVPLRGVHGALRFGDLVWYGDEECMLGLVNDGVTGLSAVDGGICPKVRWDVWL